MPYKVPKITICEHFSNILYHKRDVSFDFQALLFDTFISKNRKLFS